MRDRFALYFTVSLDRSSHLYPGTMSNMNSLKSSLSLAALMFLTHGCTASEQNNSSPAKDNEYEPRDNDESIAQYQHPLQMAQTIAAEDGIIPFVDSINSSKGQRFAMVDSIHVDQHGNSEKFSGIRRIPVKTREDLPESATTHYPSEDNKIAEPLKATAAKLIESGHPEALVEAIIRVRRPFSDTLTGELNTSIAMGEIVTDADYKNDRIARINTRKEELGALLTTLAVLVSNLGGKVVYTCENAPCLIAKLPAQQLENLAKIDNVIRMDAPTGVHEETLGDQVRKGSQIDQLVDLAHPFNGGHEDFDSQFDNLRFAILDGGFADHPSFNDGPLNHDPGDPSSRIIFYRECGSVAACSATSFCTSGGVCDHGTGVASILFGDLWDNQINTLTTTQRDQWTGYAGEALGYLYTYIDDDNNANIDSTGLAWIKAFDNVSGLSPKPVVMNLSAGIGQGDINNLSTDNDPGYPSKWDHCNGIDSVSQGANDLFEAGVLLIKSAGNQGVANGTDECTVTIPGSAAGVFTVGDHNGGNNGGINQVRNKGLSATSSRGPNLANWDRGRGRTTIDLTAFGARSDLADSSSSGGWYSQADTGGTSFAAPVVSAAAISFADHYKTVYSDLIDDPGVLFANLLLMGDRATGELNNKILTGFDRGFGAGRLKTRKFDDSGMGTPWGYETGVECIASGESLQFYLGDPLPEGVDTLKMVAWWYDRRHELDDQNRIANIDLQLWKLDSNFQKIGVLPDAESVSDTDDKERITVIDPVLGNNRWLIEIHGVDDFDSNFTYGGCRLNGWITLYTALYYESSDRNVEVDGPFWSNSAGSWNGVEPEDVAW